MNKIAKYLNKFIIGTVYDNQSVLNAYSTDRSVLKINPKVVAVPRTTHDIRKLVRFSNQLALKNVKIPVTVRGTGLDKTGAALGSGIIISTEKMNNIQEVDPRQRLVRVQAGVTLGQLNSALSLHSLAFPYHGDPNQTVGGLIANTYADFGENSKYGSLLSRVAQAEVVLSSGDVIQTDRLSARQLNKKQGSVELEGEIYRRLSDIIDDNPDLAAEADARVLPQIKSKNGSMDLLPIFFGSQGAYGIITEVILTCELLADEPQYFVAGFSNPTAALDFVTYSMTLDPLAVDIYDVALFNNANELGKTFRPFKKIPENGIVVSVQLNDMKKRKLRKKIKLLTSAQGKNTRFAISDEENYGEFIELQSVLSTYLNDVPRATHAPIVDDVYIADDKLKKYFTSLVELEKKYKISLPVFGSALNRNYSIRPEIDLTSVAGRQFVVAFLRDYADAISACDGKLAGGSPEGRVKAVCANTKLSPELEAIRKKIKEIFDVNDILNPGIKQNATLKAVVRQLRTSYNDGIISE